MRPQNVGNAACPLCEPKTPAQTQTQKQTQVKAVNRVAGAMLVPTGQKGRGRE